MKDILKNIKNIIEDGYQFANVILILSVLIAIIVNAIVKNFL